MYAAHYVNRAALKREARRSRRSHDRAHLIAVRQGRGDDDLPWRANWQISDRWRHD